MAWNYNYKEVHTFAHVWKGGMFMTFISLSSRISPILITLLALLLTACGTDSTATPLPTATPAPTATPVPTIAPSPTAVLTATIGDQGLTPTPTGQSEVSFTSGAD